MIQRKSKIFIPEIKKNIIEIGVGMLVLAAVALVLFIILGRFNLAAFIGIMAGSVFAFLNFVFLSLSVQGAVDREEQTAKNYMGLTYILRLVLTAGFVILMIKMPNVNYLAAVIPLTFPRIIIIALNSRKGDR